MKKIVEYKHTKEAMREEIIKRMDIFLEHFTLTENPKEDLYSICWLLERDTYPRREPNMPYGYSDELMELCKEAIKRNG